MVIWILWLHTYDHVSYTYTNILVRGAPQWGPNKINTFIRFLFFSI